ncbi:hypothetical protein [Enterocloster clostridioformis]|uniref:hypothetical protein n=1 Tax=Enterocloster clostridioformis TaxID=1531 RepID=UPI0032C0E7E3
MIERLKDNFNKWRCRVYKRKHDKAQQKYSKYAEKCKNRELQIQELETETGQEKAWQERYIKSKAYMSIVLGLMMLILTFCLSYICETSSWDVKLKALCAAAVTGFNSVFSIVIGIGISTLVLDFFSYIRYTRNRIKEIMLDKNYIETLSDKEKRRMIESAEQSLYFKNGEFADNSLYANIKELIIPLIEENYYKQYKVHVDCYVDENRGVITKRVHKIMDIMCISDKKDFKIPFSTYLLRQEGFSERDLYKINEFIFDGNNITEDIAEHIVNNTVDNEEDIEDIRFTVDYSFKLKKGLNRIEIKTETVVPIADNTYSHTITIPCRRYSINFTVHNENYDVLGFAFAFDDEEHKDDISKIIYRDKYDECFKIRFEDWTLPGDGVVFVINKKDDKIKKA